MSKHTPGPWTLERYSKRDNEALITFGGRSVRDGDFVYSAWQRMNEADAILACAAPDLLNALVTLANAAESSGIPVDAARAAIAKARGGA